MHCAISLLLPRLAQTSPYVPNPTDLAHAPSFTLPIIALVIITILNDGCMITIAYDHVVSVARRCRHPRQVHCHRGSSPRSPR